RFFMSVSLGPGLQRSYLRHENATSGRLPTQRGGLHRRQSLTIAPMSRLRAWKRLQKPQLALLVLLSLGMAVQSIILVPSQTHEFLLHVEAGGDYTHEHAPHGHDESHDGDAGHGGPLLHMFLHQPCGSHCAWMHAAHAIAFLPLARPAPPADQPVRPVHPFELTAPFRPPIAA